MSRYMGMMIAAALVVACVGGPTIAEAKAADPNIVVVLRGVGELMAEPPIEGALCYGAELVDAKTDRTLGTGIDCLEDITPVGDSISINRTTFFFFPQGDLVANGPTTVAPFVSGPTDFTHVVGDVPGEGTNSIVGGTRRFKKATGSVRLSGAVDLSVFPDAVGFNCIFVIDLD